jgi:hypothetical protein
MYPCTLIHVHRSMYINPCTSIRVHHWSMYTDPCTLIHVHWPMYINPCTSIHVHLSMYIYPCTSIHVHLSMYIYPCTLIHAHWLMCIDPCTYIDIAFKTSSIFMHAYDFPSLLSTFPNYILQHFSGYHHLSLASMGEFPRVPTFLDDRFYLYCLLDHDLIISEERTLILNWYFQFDSFVGQAWVLWASHKNSHGSLTYVDVVTPFPGFCQ